MKLLLTCEHAGNQVPRPFARHFRGRRWILNSHRGWDPGSLTVARAIASQTRVPLKYHPFTRLLVDVNRCLDQETLFSSSVVKLSEREREFVLNKYYKPYHSEVLRALRHLGRKGFHLSIHSFTPIKNGLRRECEVGLLFKRTDLRARAQAIALRRAILVERPRWRVRFNYPYDAEAGGIREALRPKVRPLPPGIYMEVNQRLLRDPLTARKAAATIARAVGVVFAAKRP